MENVSGVRFITLVICLVFAFDTGLTYLGLDPQGSVETWVMLVGAFSLSAACIVFNSYNHEKDWRVTGIVLGLTVVIAFINYNAFMRKHTEADAHRQERIELESQLYSLEQINDCQNDIVWRGGERVKARCTSDDLRTHNVMIRDQLSLIPSDLPAKPTAGEKAFRIGLALFLPLLHIAGGLLLRQKVQITWDSVHVQSNVNNLPPVNNNVNASTPTRQPERAPKRTTSSGRPIPELSADVRAHLRETWLEMTDRGKIKIKNKDFHAEVKHLPGCGHYSAISNWIKNECPVVNNVHELNVIQGGNGGRMV